MRILIATTQVPFVWGGAEAHAEGLRAALCAAGHAAEVIRVPFKGYPPQRIPEQMLACRLLDVTESCGAPIDMLIGLKFPAYLIPHPNKVLWIVHQHRMAYELWDHPLVGELIQFPAGRQVRALIHAADRQLIPQARAVFANSRTVAGRLKRDCDIDATPLYHPPPHSDLFSGTAYEEYLFFPSRLNHLKRQALVLRALAHTGLPVRVRFAGWADDPEFLRELQRLASDIGVAQRVEWLGLVDEEEKRRQYGRALAIVFPPEDEDYGYVTLEAMLSSKAVITCTDSGGPLEFVLHQRTGLVAEPTPAALAAAMDRVWAARDEARVWGEAGRARYDDLAISWRTVVRTLLA
jgi:glycosyltransferase involved in cell wall biosynthesis